MSPIAQETASGRSSEHDQDDTFNPSSHASHVKDSPIIVVAEECSQAMTQSSQQGERRLRLEVMSLPFYDEWLSTMSMHRTLSSSKAREDDLVMFKPSIMKHVTKTMHIVSGTSDCHAGKFFARVHEDVRAMRSIWCSTAPITRSSPFKVDYRRHSKW